MKKPTVEDLLKDIDNFLCKIEDYTHGEDGKEVTTLRCKISTILDLRLTSPSPKEPSKSGEDWVVLPSKLTAENGAKALLMGEFSEAIEVTNGSYCGCGKCDFCNEFPNEPETIQKDVPVSWTNIKEIYKKIVFNYAQQSNKPVVTEELISKDMIIQIFEKTGTWQKDNNDKTGTWLDEEDVSDIADKILSLQHRRESDAVEFKRWCDNGNPFFFDSQTQHTHTDEELYDLFTQSKGTI